MTYRYQLIDANDNTTTIQDQTFKLLTDAFDIEVDIVEKSFTSGADFPGIQRDASKELTFRYDINEANEQTFRTYFNELTRQFRKTIKIKDLFNNIETEVLYQNQTISYDEGGFLHGSAVEVTFVQLRPFWEDSTFQIATESGLTAGEITINNNGYIETPSIITIEASELITKMSIRINETGDGIIIRDLQFGTRGLNTYIIDNKAGTAELNQILRNQKIQNETGFFNLQVGINTMIFELNGAAEIEVKWKRRYYI
jgi:hypothetical protein